MQQEVRSFKGWFYGWKATIYIHLFDRETLRYLKEPFEIGDFVEVASPGEVLQRHEKQTLESYLEGLAGSDELT